MRFQLHSVLQDFSVLVVNAASLEATLRFTLML